MKIWNILETPCARIIFFLSEQGEVRYSKLTKLVPSRGTLSSNLRDLEQEGLIKRRVTTTKPIQSIYSLTEKGTIIAENLLQMRKTLRS